MTLKPRADQNFIHSHHNEPRVQLFVPKEETFPILLKYIDVTRATHTDEDVMQEKRTDYLWNVDSNRSLSVSWKGFTKFTLLKAKLPKGHMWCGRRLTKVQTTSRQDHVWPEVWTNIGKALRIDRKKNGKTRSQNSTMLEDWQEFTSLILMIKITKKLSKMRGENWKDPWHQLCLPTGWFTLASRKWLQSRKLLSRDSQKRFMVVRWNLMNPQDNEWNLLYLHNMKTSSQAEDRTRWHITMWHTSLFDEKCKGSSERMQLQHSNWKKSTARRRLFSKHKETKGKSILLHWWKFVAFKNAELEPKLQDYKGRVVLRGDIVKDDPGAYAVFTEQGSSASQMTAAKVMDDIARLSECDGQAADAVSAYTHRKMEDAPTLQKIQSECPDVWIRLPPHKCRNPWQTWKIPWYFSNEMCMASAYQDFYGKVNSRKFCWNFDWKKYQIGNVFLFIENKD